MKVLLVNPPSPGIYNIIGLKLPPLGLGYLASMLRESGHQVKLVDLQVEKNKKLEEEIKEADLIGITSETNKIFQALEVAKIAKDQNKIVVMGGYHTTFQDQEALQTGLVDYVVRGEGEYTFSQLVNHLEKDLPLDEVNGISYLKQGQLIRNTDALPPQDLDALPFPARDLMPLKKYWMTQVEGEPLVNVITSRGCPFSCSFCASSHFSGRKWRARSPENIIQELEQIYFDLGYRGIAFVDDNFTLSPARIENLCDLIAKRKMKLKWWCFSRADTIVKNESMIKKMAQAGLRMVYLGFESAEEEVLETYHKKLSTEISKKAVKILKKYGVKTWGSFILGSVRETKESIQKTIEFAKNIAPDLVQFSILTPFPGTETFAQFSQEKRIYTFDWRKFDGAHPVVAVDYLKPKELTKLLNQAYFEFYKQWRYLPQAFDLLKKLILVNVPLFSTIKENQYWKERLRRENC
ncbi:MAG: anaerobic magnesium-protoporphyrin monomethyl ester cyclase [Candidatus Atribacteria bacterium]|nr:anaerobic magnesium-protoporphyrin monomethyl ester cyclase [Candidatus Atribacteria bacterium]